MVGLKGYRDLGGIRVSMYNAVTVDNIKTLVGLHGGVRQEARVETGIRGPGSGVRNDEDTAGAGPRPRPSHFPQRQPPSPLGRQTQPTNVTSEATARRRRRSRCWHVGVGLEERL